MAWQPRQHEDGTQARDSKQRRLLHALPGRTRNGLLQRPTGGLKNQHFSIALRLMISAPNSQFGAAGFLDCRGATTESGHTTEGTFYFCGRDWNGTVYSNYELRLQHCTVVNTDYS